ncbi:MAG TPA: hypothetical protein VHV51_19505 [Polyangiaceae bacterium]|jgi:hypothetical protein|nr:hypothetical protein [Polyangiaceae bacterium]
MAEVDESAASSETTPPSEGAREAQAAADERPKSVVAKQDDEINSLNAEGRERPHFVLDFPDDPELQRLVRAFEAGDYATVRSGAPRLAETTENPTVAAAARELRKRIDPDPLMKYLLCVALALFVFVVWYTYQNHARP